MEGYALKYKDNINTDIISPPQYMELSIEEASHYSMSAVDDKFYDKVQTNKIFVAEDNLGSGSSRETAPMTFKHLGVEAVIACSFARIFYRNLINLGIPALVCSDAYKIQEGDFLKIDVENGSVENITRQETYSCSVLPDHIMKIVHSGGLFPYLKKEYGTPPQ